VLVFGEEVGLFVVHLSEAVLGLVSGVFCYGDIEKGLTRQCSSWKTDMDLVSFASFGCWTNARPFGIRLFHIFSVSALGSPAKLSLSDQTTFSILRCGLPYGAGDWSVLQQVPSQQTTLRDKDSIRNCGKLTKVSIDIVFNTEQSAEAEAD